jgi:hypothetical protein
MEQKVYPDNTCKEDPGVSSSPIAFGPGSIDGGGDGTYSGNVAFEIAEVSGGFTVKFTGGTWLKSDGNTGGFNSMTLSGPASATIALNATSGTLPAGSYSVLLTFNLFGVRNGFFSPDIPHLVVGRRVFKTIVDEWDFTRTFVPGVDSANVPSCIEAPQINLNTRTVDGADDSVHFPGGAPNSA